MSVKNQRPVKNEQLKNQSKPKGSNSHNSRKASPSKDSGGHGT